MNEETAESAQHAFYHEPHFWVAVSFVIFVAIFVKYVLPPIVKVLDKRSADIANQLEQADRLRAEAEALLAASKMQQQEIQQEAKTILAQAQKDAEEIRAKATADLEQTMARRIAMVDENINRTQINTIQKLRAQMIDVATETAREVIATQLKNQKDDPAITRALESIERQIH